MSDYEIKINKPLELAEFNHKKKNQQIFKNVARKIDEIFDPAEIIETTTKTFQLFDKLQSYYFVLTQVLLLYF